MYHNTVRMYMHARFGWLILVHPPTCKKHGWQSHTIRKLRMNDQFICTAFYPDDARGRRHICGNKEKLHKKIILCCLLMLVASCNWLWNRPPGYLSSKFQQHIQFPFLSCEALICHVACWAPGTDEHFTWASSCAESYVLKVRANPTVCLAIHSFWAQCSCN